MLNLKCHVTFPSVSTLDETSELSGAYQWRPKWDFKGELKIIIIDDDCMHKFPNSCKNK